MMDWDNITQTGARASGVEETTPRMAVHHRAHLIRHSAGRKVEPRSVRRADANRMPYRVCLVLA
jgi:hypothetical protein